MATGCGSGASGRALSALEAAAGPWGPAAPCVGSGAVQAALLGLGGGLVAPAASWLQVSSEGVGVAAGGV